MSCTVRYDPSIGETLKATTVKDTQKEIEEHNENNAYKKITQIDSVNTTDSFFS